VADISQGVPNHYSMKKILLMVALIFIGFSAAAQNILAEGSNFWVSKEQVLLSDSNQSFHLALVVMKEPTTGVEVKALLLGAYTIHYKSVPIPAGGLFLIRTAGGEVMELTDERATAGPDRLAVINKAAKKLTSYPLFGCYPVTDEQLALLYDGGVQKVRVQCEDCVIEQQYSIKYMLYSGITFQLLIDELQEYSAEIERQRAEMERQEYLDNLQDIREGF
jgi:hypothetical protein